MTVSGEPNKFNTDKVEALAVDTETEKAHQLRHQRRMDDLIDKKYLAATTQDSEDSASGSPSVDDSEARAASESEEAGRGLEGDVPGVEWPSPAEAQAMTKKEKKKAPNVGETGQLVPYVFHEKKTLDNFGDSQKHKIEFLGPMREVYFQGWEPEENLGPFLTKAFADRCLYGMIDLAPVVIEWPNYQSEDKNGEPCEKQCSGPVSDASEQSKRNRLDQMSKKGFAPFKNAVLRCDWLMVSTRAEGANGGKVAVFDWGDPSWFDGLECCMSVETLKKMEVRRIRRLLDIHESGRFSPSVNDEQRLKLIEECLNLELVYLDQTKMTRGEFTWYVRCTCCGVAFQLWSRCKKGEEKDHLRSYDWRKAGNADKTVIEHFESCEHLAVYSENGELLTGVLGQCLQKGFATRQLRRGKVLAGSWYQFEGMWLDSPCTEAAPLPTQECVHQWLGRPEGLIPVVWQSLTRNKVVVSVQAPGGRARIVPIGVEDVKALHAGVVYWGIDQMATRYQNTAVCQKERLPSAYSDFASLPKTNNQYFKEYLRVTPSASSPHPEQLILKSVRGKLNTPKGAEALDDKEAALFRLPPGTNLQSWYPAVRLELREKSKVRELHPELKPVICMVQALDDEGDEQMTAWGLLFSKLKLTDKVQESLETLTKRLGMEKGLFLATGYMGKSEPAQ